MATLFRRILVPYDFSPPATRALKTAAELAAAHRGRLVVLHAVTPFYPVTDLPMAETAAWIPPADLVAEARKRLEALVARTLRGRKARATCIVEIGDPYQSIIAAARKADTIVMSTHGRTGLTHLLIGSVAEKVVRHAPVPVLVLRAGARTKGRRR
jgi:universal stress protein A